jgi:hypothetical protein
MFLGLTKLFLGFKFYFSPHALIKVDKKYLKNFFQWKYFTLLSKLQIAPEGPANLITGIRQHSVYLEKFIFCHLASFHLRRRTYSS